MGSDCISSCSLLIFLLWRRRSLKMVDDGPWLYYKLANEPKSSGELKKKFNAYRPLKPQEKKKKKKKKDATSPTYRLSFKIRVKSLTRLFFWPNGYPQHMFLWRTDENYPSTIIKYPPYLIFSHVILLVLSCGGSYHNMHLNVQNSVYCHFLI